MTHFRLINTTSLSETEIMLIMLTFSQNDVLYRKIKNHQFILIREKILLVFCTILITMNLF